MNIHRVLPGSQHWWLYIRSQINVLQQRQVCSNGDGIGSHRGFFEMKIKAANAVLGLPDAEYSWLFDVCHLLDSVVVPPISD